MHMRELLAIAALTLAVIAIYSLARGLPAGVFGAGEQQRAPIHSRVDPPHEQREVAP
ncbi:hypothetical protein P3T32_000950 [Ralstonia sp. GP73]|uniref:Uncharacterized protein n=2 Tax=Ralstonia TaxID=48736 RepID=A0AAD2BJD2_9RALS|nr:hypothetical protein OR214_02945 [Ralstonia pickettii OR214]MDH6641115.1 hypothetical protein [Ralstonia sp. GP73]CAJ0706433.1 hypothetical protein LMG7143_00170 [Ralstonia sp. LMG 18095]CAJ0775300.1 hypothetical protein LMG18095_00032 [Ralstonia sp. LMG 18095]CAJ0776474.1 hypothetical protein R77560_00159 [Ralstonia sp. LMG 18095]